MPDTNPIAGICSYCGKVYRDGRLPFSHGICPECYTEQINKIRGEPYEHTNPHGCARDTGGEGY